jgi:DNA sulfur modification protein DndC
MVTWIEWLRRSRQIYVPEPRLVRSDTTVEFPFLVQIAEKIEDALVGTGWIVEKVAPLRRNKLYVQIFGRGTTPVNPGYRKMRWCTASTKISPMKRERRKLGKDVVALSAVRWGESAKRDVKIQATCSAGGECGVIQTSAKENVFGPIMEWSLCQVYDWLTGMVGKEIKNEMGDLFELTNTLVEVYDFRTDDRKLIGLPIALAKDEMNSLRFGCIGCPAIVNDKALNRAVEEHPEWRFLRAIHSIWDALRLPENRCQRVKQGKVQCGPIKMEVRKHYFDKLLSIQKQSGVCVVTNKDIELIRTMWGRGEYPRGWSEMDERVVRMSDGSSEGRIVE